MKKGEKFYIPVLAGVRKMSLNLLRIFFKESWYRIALPKFLLFLRIWFLRLIFIFT